MTWVAKHLKSRNTGLELNGEVPHRCVAERSLFKGREPAVDGSHTLYARTVQALQRADPQLQIWIDRVFDHHRNVNSAQRVGNLLHRKWIYGRSCTNPQYVDACLQAQFDVSGGGHFRGN